MITRFLSEENINFRVSPDDAATISAGSQLPPLLPKQLNALRQVGQNRTELFHRTLATSSPELWHNGNQAWQVTLVTKVRKE
jgi:hypothetical protein